MEMPKKTSRIVWIYAIVVHITLFGFVMMWKSSQIAQQSAEKSLSAYRVANGRNVARMNSQAEIKAIQEAIADNPAPEGLIWAIRVHENGMPGHEYGMKKFFGNKNQLESCVYLIQERMTSYVELNKREFTKHVAKRYNNADKERWLKSTLYLWIDYNKKREKI